MLFICKTNLIILQTFSLAGLGAGITEAILVNPFEVVKVTLQSNKAISAQLPSTWFVTRQIVREHGLGSKGLNKGLTATIARNGIFNMVYFGFYHSVKGYVPEYEVGMESINCQNVRYLDEVKYKTNALVNSITCIRQVPTYLPT